MWQKRKRNGKRQLDSNTRRPSSGNVPKKTANDRGNPPKSFVSDELLNWGKMIW